MKRMKLSMMALGICMISGHVYAQSYTANFAVVPPVIDGQVSPGEWDAASPAITSFNSHDNAGQAEDPAERTSVRVLYSVDGLYILYENMDTNVQSVTIDSEHRGAGGGWTFANTDYLAIYFDPANVADDRTDVDPSFYSYSLQAEPSITVNEEMDELGHSYSYTEFGRFGGMKIRNPDADGTNDYWVGGGSWDLTDASMIKDGASANGYVMEFKIAWSDINHPYYEHFGAEILDGNTFVDVEANFETTQWGLARVDGGDVGCMPLPGTVWKVNFCRHSASAAVQYVNWVGGTGGFVSRPFGDLVFGEASATAVREAMLHR